jgi:hypothetical protein
MKNNNLVPTRIVNANGVTTTVHRKPPASSTGIKNALPPVKATADQRPATKLLITTAALALGLDNKTTDRLTRKAEELDPASQAALLNLMGQPDPHGTLRALLNQEFNAVFPKPDQPDMRIFAQWVTNADNHLHAVESLVRDIDNSKAARTITKVTISGLNQTNYQNYTHDQLRGIALITAAAVTIASNNQKLDHDLTESEWPNNTHRHLSSGIVLDLITASNETATEALRLVTEEHVLTNAELIHRLDGTPRALVSGVI